MYTWFGTTFDGDKFDDSGGAALDGFVGLPSIDVNQLHLAVLCAQQNEVRLKHRCDQGAYHRVVLDYSLKEQSLDSSVASPHHLPDV